MTVFYSALSESHSHPAISAFHPDFSEPCVPSATKFPQVLQQSLYQDNCPESLKEVLEERLKMSEQLGADVEVSLPFPFQLCLASCQE